MLKRALAVLAAALAVAGGQAAAAAPVATVTIFKARADAYLERAYPADGPGAAVIIRQNGRTIYARGRGLADVEARTPITPDTVFRLGSISKQFTAAVILQLVGEGRISLDDPLSRFFPDHPAPGAAATVRQLLNHTSGIVSYSLMPGRRQRASRPRTSAEMLAAFRDQPAQFPPGERWFYNNSGYFLAGEIIERVTGRSWHRNVAERIARPLRLASLRHGGEEARIPGMTRGYMRAAAGGFEPSLPMHPTAFQPDGGLTASVRDMAAWAEALHGGRVIRPQLYGEMIRPTQLLGGRSEPYGLGLRPSTVRGRTAIGHGGNIYGTDTFDLYLPGERLFVAVFTNSDQPTTRAQIAARRLAAMALGDPYPELGRAEVDLAALEPLFGEYRSAAGKDPIVLAARGSRLVTRGFGGSREVLPAGGDRFFYGDSLSWFSIRRSADGAHVMELRQQAEDPAELRVRAGPVPPQPPTVQLPQPVLQHYVGTYQLGWAALKVTITAGGTLALQVDDETALPLAALSERRFTAPGSDTEVEFEGAEGATTGIVLLQNGQRMIGRRRP